MRLGAIFLLDVADVNSFREAEQFLMTAGDSYSAVYFQLRDMTVNPFTDNVFAPFKNPGRRYMPAVGATLSVQIDTLDDAQLTALTKTCSQPFPTKDPSIWTFVINATDPISGTKRLKLTLTEGTKVTRGVVNSAILATPTT